jgi:enoyl-CoA hydratase
VSPFVELGFEGPLARLTLKRADKLNALDRAMIDALADAARAIDASSETRVAILSGEGKAFCAGGDIGAWGGLPPLEMWRDWTRAGHRAFGAPACSAHCGGHGTCLWRRARTGGRRRYSHRRERN